MIVSYKEFTRILMLARSENQVSIGTKSSYLAERFYLSNWKNILAVCSTRISDIGISAITNFRCAHDWTTDIIDYFTFQVFDASTQEQLSKGHSLYLKSAHLDQGVLNVHYQSADITSPLLEIYARYALMPYENYLLMHLKVISAKDALLRASTKANKSFTPIQQNIKFKQNLHLALFKSSSLKNTLLYLLLLHDNQGEDNLLPSFEQSTSHTLESERSLTWYMHLSAQEQYSFSFYIGLTDNIKSAFTTVHQLNNADPEHIFYSINQHYSKWVNQLSGLSSLSKEHKDIVIRSLLDIKCALHPSFAYLPSHSDNSPYEHIAFAYDSCLTAIGLDAYGCIDEAQKYWKWMADCQNEDGTWHTVFDAFTGLSVYPDLESNLLGLFLIGVWKHFELSHDINFLQDTWKSIKKAASYLQNHTDLVGHGPADFHNESNTSLYTVASHGIYVAGLTAASNSAYALGYRRFHERFLQAAATIKSYIQRSYSENPPGLWHETIGCYILGQQQNGRPIINVDPYSLSLIIFGTIDTTSYRAHLHMNTVCSVVDYSLPRPDIGNKTQFHQNNFNADKYPPKNLAQDITNAVIMLSICESYVNNKEQAYKHLSWYAQRYSPITKVVNNNEIGAYLSLSNDALTSPISTAFYLIATRVAFGTYHLKIHSISHVLGFYSPESNVPNTLHLEHLSYIPYALLPELSERGANSAVFAWNDYRNLYIVIYPNLSYLPESVLNSLVIYINSGKATSYYSYKPDGATSEEKADIMIKTSEGTASIEIYTYSDERWQLHAITSDGTIHKSPDLALIHATVPLYSIPRVSKKPHFNIQVLVQNHSFKQLVANFWYYWRSKHDIQIINNIRGPWILDVSSYKAQYRPGELAVIQVFVLNPSFSTLKNARITARLHNLDKVVLRKELKIPPLEPGHAIKAVLPVRLDNSQSSGYLLAINLESENEVLLDLQTLALDTAKTPMDFLRYGFVSNYDSDISAYLISELLSKFRINAIQFYDWQWKHHMPLCFVDHKMAASWPDIHGRINKLSTICQLISEFSMRNIASFNYNLIYGAWDDYTTDGSGVKQSWGLFSDPNAKTQVSMQLPPGWQTSRIFIFNPASLEWQHYIFEREKQVFDNLEFFGWHADQLGALGHTYDALGNKVDLDRTFAPFLKNARESLGIPIIFNAVGQYGQANVARSNATDATYTECWEEHGQKTHLDIKKVIDQNISYSNKSTIIAAYLHRDFSESLPDATYSYFNEPSLLVLEAIILANGGFHITLGDILHYLSEPYFPAYKLILSDSTAGKLRDYFNFAVAYENILRGYADNADINISLSGLQTSTTAEPGKIFTLAKKINRLLVVHLINMQGVIDERWQDPERVNHATLPITNVQLSLILKDSENVQVAKCWMCSPEYNHMLPVALEHHKDNDKFSLVIPYLNYWDMVVLDLGGA
jgi:dextranase